MWLRGAVVWNFMWVEPLPVVLPAHIRKPPYYGYEFVKVALKEL